MRTTNTGSNNYLQSTHYVEDLRPLYQICNQRWAEYEQYERVLSHRLFYMLVYLALGYHELDDVVHHIRQLCDLDIDYTYRFVEKCADDIEDYIRDIYDEEIWVSDVRFYLHPKYQDPFLLIFTYPAEYSRDIGSTFPSYLYGGI